MNDKLEKIDKFDLSIISCLQKTAPCPSASWPIGGPVAERLLAPATLECLRHHPWHAGRGQPGGAGPGPDGVRHDPDQPRQAWADGFRLHVERLPEVTEFYRIGGDWDYLIKVVCRGMAGYDRFYKS